MSDVLEQAKALFDKELDNATAEIIKRWEAHYNKTARAARLKAIVEALKGGPGSGNFGHAGRPGLRGGSSPGGSKGASDEGYYTNHAQTDKTINRVLNELATRTDSEKSFIINGEGNVSWNSGDTGTAHEVEATHDFTGGKVLLHNHPGLVNMFTEGDIRTFLKETGLDSSIVVTNTKKGEERLVHWMKRTPDTKTDFSRLGFDFTDAYSKATNKYENDYLDDKLTNAQYRTKVGIETMHELSKMYGFNYGHTEFKES